MNPVLDSNFFPSSSFPYAPAGQVKTKEVQITNQRESWGLWGGVISKGSHFCLFISRLSDKKILDLFDYSNMGSLQSLCTILNSKCSETVF